MADVPEDSAPSKGGGYRSAETLFRPFRLKGLRLANRLAMAPMGRHFAEDGQPSENYAAYYARRAAGGIGLITSQATPVPHPTASNASTYGVFEGEEALQVWRNVVRSVHGAGGKYFQQLFHIGGARAPGEGPNPDLAAISPSGIYQPLTGGGEPLHSGREASDGELADVIAAFAKAAGTAKSIGCDGINLHAAHGYLLDQFLWPAHNRRTDQFGPAQPTAFAEEVVRECRRVVGPDFPIFMRISQWKQQDYSARLWPTPQDLESALAPLVSAGVDLFDCSTRRFWVPEYPGSDLNLAGWVKKVTGLPTMTVGAVGLDREGINPKASTRAEILSPYAAPAAIDRLIDMLERDDFDLVALGRVLISNPDWADKVRSGAWDAIKRFDTADLAHLH